MPLHHPPAISILGFNGGYIPDADYLSLQDSETKIAKNCIYTVAKTLDKRNGYERMYNTTLNGGGSTSIPITGHYFFEKLGNTNTFHVVASNGSLYNYTSSTANVIRSGLNTSSETYWGFIQFQDFRSAADDIIIGTNGVDNIQMWNGSATAVNFSAATSATQIVPVNILLFHQERVYGINVVDSTDADASVRVFRSGFGTDGLADPHRWTENFYVGGSSKDGRIQNAAILDNQIIFYKERAIWKYNPSTGGVGDLITAKDDIGLYAKYSLVDVGDFHIFLSERGVYAFDGNQVTRVSERQDIKLFEECNLAHLYKAKAVFDETNEHYTLYYPSKNSSRNDTAIVFDLKQKIWQPPITGKQVSFISTFTNSLNREQVIFGDYYGYMYKDNQGTSDGLATGYNSYADSGAINSIQLKINSTASDTSYFTTAGDGLRGLYVRIIDGYGEGQERIIVSNTSQSLTLESQWDFIPNTTSFFTVCGIDDYWQSKDFSFGNEDIRKLFRSITVKGREDGNYNLVLTYIIDFNTKESALQSLVTLLEDGFAWDEGLWDDIRWDGRQSIKKVVSIRNDQTQPRIGTHISIAIENKKANQIYRIHGFDIVAKGVGKSWQ